MKITKRQLRRIIREEKARLLREEEDMSMYDDITKVPLHLPPRPDKLSNTKPTAMGQTAKSDELFNARDTLLGILETMDPDQAGAYIEDLVQELQMMQREM